MRILVIIDPGRLLTWHDDAMTRLAEAGHDVSWAPVPDPDPFATSLSVVLDIDQALIATRDLKSARQQGMRFRRNAAHLRAPKRAANFEPDVIIDVTGRPLARARSMIGEARVLAAAYDGQRSDDALWGALLASRAPELTIIDTAGSPWRVGLPALERPWRLAPSLDTIGDRLSDAFVRIMQSVSDGARANPRDDYKAVEQYAHPENQLVLSYPAAAARYLARRNLRKLKAVRTRISSQQPKWAVAWREIDAITPLTLDGEIDLASYRLLPDDGARYYADPFIFAHNGTRYIFLEEYPDDTARGIISVTTIGSDGTASRPEPVLSMPHHLSYPQVFARDGEIWMLPESAAGGGLDLFKAEKMPDRWVNAARLIDQPLHDATLFEHAGQLWISAAGDGRSGQPWDTLLLFSSPKLLGPWVQHKANPVLMNAAAARPAGPIFTVDGKLIRPAQDCSAAYGGAMTFARIDTLDNAQYAQTAAGKIRFNPSSGLLGPHTFSRAAGIEAIDVFASDKVLKANATSGRTSGEPL